MSAEENALENQKGLWTLLGPIILLVTLTILLINPVHQSLLIPLISLAAIPACWKWKMRGLSIALGCLAILFVYQFLKSTPGIIFWELMLTLSAALTYTITAFCSLEVGELFKQQQKDSISELQEFQGIHEKMHLAEEQKFKEIGLALAKVELMQQKLNEQTALLQTREEEVSITREKIGNIAAQNENLLRELFQKRHECDKLVRQLETNELEIKDLKKEIQLLAAAPPQIPVTAPPEEVMEAQLLESIPPKTKKGKSKTNNWADTIMSRWSETK